MNHSLWRFHPFLCVYGFNNLADGGIRTISNILPAPTNTDMLVRRNMVGSPPTISFVQSNPRCPLKSLSPYITHAILLADFRIIACPGSQSSQPLSSEYLFLSNLFNCFKTQHISAPNSSQTRVRIS